MEQEEIVKEYLIRAKKVLDADLNIPGLVAVLWEVFGHMGANVRSQDEVMKKLDEVLGLMLITPPSILENIELPVEVKNLVKERETARAEKDFTKSDALRVKIEALGFELMDTENGQKVKKKPQI